MPIFVETETDGDTVRILAEAVGEARRILGLQLEEMGRQVQQTERVRGLGLAGLGAAIAIAGIFAERGATVGLVPMFLFGVAVVFDLVGVVKATVDLASLPRYVAGGPDIGDMLASVGDPEWNLSSYFASLLVTYDADSYRNNTGIKNMARGRRHAMSYLGVSLSAYLLAFLYILGGAILHAA